MIQRFRSKHLLICFSLLVALLGQPILAAEYFVAHAPSAADSNTGDAQHPWKTLNYALTQTQPGDMVWVAAGDYRNEDAGWGIGVIAFSNSGLEKKPIQIRAKPGQPAIVGSFLLKEKQFIEVSGFQLRNPEFSTLTKWRDMPEIVYSKLDETDPPACDFSATWEDRRPWVEARFADYFQMIQQLEYRSAIDMEGCQNITVVGNEIYGYWAGVQCRGCQNIEMIGNKISHCVNGVFTFRPAPALVDSRIVENVISQCLDNGIDIREASSNVLIEKNTVRLSGRSHISLLGETRDCQIRNNNVQFGGYYSESMEYPGSSAINVHSSYKGTVVEANIAAFQIDRTGVDGNGLILDLMKPGATVTVRNNLFFRNSGAGLNTTKSPNAVIHNNAFVENGFTSTGLREGVGIKFSRDEDIGHTVVNNLFVNNRSAGIFSDFKLNKQKRIDHNLYYSNVDSPLIWDGYQKGDREYVSLSQLRSETPWERNGVEGDPLFRGPIDEQVRPEAFHLKVGSPAIGAASSDVPNLDGFQNIGPRWDH